MSVNEIPAKTVCSETRSEEVTNTSELFNL